MKTNNFRCKLRSILIISILLFSGSLIMLTQDAIIQEAMAVDFWEKTSKNDFQKGTRENVTIIGSGNNAELHLLLNNYWEDPTPSPKPTLRYAHGMATIFGTEEFLLFGGSRNNDDTWIYDFKYNTWTEKFPVTKPMGRQYFAMSGIYDTDNVLMFGGLNWGLGRQNDTWIYDYSSNRWIRKYPVDYPSERGNVAMTYVYDSDKVVLFGGSDFETGYLSDTWVYDFTENNWEVKLTFGKPSARHGHAMAPVYGTDQIVLFGGYRDRTDSETWVYDLSDNSWDLRTPSTRPTPRTGHAMVSIYGEDKVLLFGGSDSETYYDDTWIYDLSEDLWTKRTYTIKPPARNLQGMATICEDDKAVMFGGTNTSKDHSDTWIYHNHVYPESGVYISEAFDAGRATPFGIISWNATLTSNTTLRIQLRSAETQSELDTKPFVGPDGSVYTFYTVSPWKLWSGHNNNRWVQYKAYFGTSDEDETPILKDISISYNVHPGPPILTGPANDTWLTNNKPKFIWQYNGSASNLPGGFRWQIDDNIDFNSVDYDSGKITSATNEYTHPAPLPDRIWYWRIRTKDYDGSWGPYSGYSILKIDTTINSPLKVTVTPTYWSSKNEFTIDWTVPEDLSGFKEGAFYLVGKSPPGAQSAGTWTNQKPFKITNAVEGINTIHIWLMDNAGNLNFENYISATFKLDTKSPKILHRPVTKGNEGKRITINAEISDDHSGVDQAYLFYKSSKNTKYSYIEMNKNDKNFSAEIPGEVVTTDDFGYYIKAIDKASPNNVIFYGKGGLTQTEPIPTNDMDISISKKEVGMANKYWLIGAAVIIVIVIIIIITFYFIKPKKSKRSSRTLDYSDQTMEPRTAPPVYDQERYTPRQQIPASYSPEPMYPIQPSASVSAPMPPPLPLPITPPAQPKVLVVYKCEACEAKLTDPNNCPYCGWSRQ